ncbi:MAG: ketopantoate reductase family protein [Clostridia bacterium]
MKIAIIGAGAMGSLYGGYLSKAGQEVYLVDVWQQHVDEINMHGLKIEEPEGEVAVYPKAAVSADTVGTVDLAIVFVKSIMTKKAMESNIALISPNTYVLSLQNGYGNIDEIEKFVKRDRIIAGTTAHGATMLSPGRIKHAGKGVTHIGSVSKDDDKKVQEIAQILKTAGFDTDAAHNVMELIWDKLIINVGINALTAVLKLRNGQLLDHDESKVIMKAAVEEAVMVANSLGMNFDNEETLKKVMEVARKTEQNMSSMLQDVTNKRKTEIDTINGAIVREGSKANISTPSNMVLTNLVKTIENSY